MEEAKTGIVSDATADEDHALDGKHTESGTKPKAHQPDGTDSSGSFQAGVADENTIPEAHD